MSRLFNPLKEDTLALPLTPGRLLLHVLQAQCRPMGFPGGSDGKESACDAGDPGSIPGSIPGCPRSQGLSVPELRCGPRLVDWDLCSLSQIHCPGACWGKWKTNKIKTPGQSSCPQGASLAEEEACAQPHTEAGERWAGRTVVSEG